MDPGKQSLIHPGLAENTAPLTALKQTLQRIKPIGPGTWILPGRFCGGYPEENVLFEEP